LQESLKIAGIPQVLPSNRTGESVPSNPVGKFRGAFLWRAHAQSGFSDSIRRMQCDHKPMMRRKSLDFVNIWECRFSHKQPFCASVHEKRIACCWTLGFRQAGPLKPSNLFPRHAGNGVCGSDRYSRRRLMSSLNAGSSRRLS
jgi:hypothetical protein